MIRSAYICCVEGCKNVENNNEKWRVVFVNHKAYTVCPSCWILADKIGQLNLKWPVKNERKTT